MSDDKVFLRILYRNINQQPLVYHSICWDCSLCISATIMAWNMCFPYIYDHLSINKINVTF